MKDSNNPLRFELAALLSIAAIGALTEAFWEAGFTSLFAGMLVYTAWHLFNLVRLTNSIRAGRRLNTSYPPGWWGLVYKNAYTLQRRVRKRNRRLSRFLKRFNESAAAFPDAAMIIGQSDDLEWCNPAADVLLGLPWPQASGQNFSDAVSDAVLREYMAEGDHERALEFQSPIDQTKMLSLRVTPFGKKHQRLVIARDITQLYYLNRMRQDFVANASHELRTPLTVISGFLEVLNARNTRLNEKSRPVEVMLQQTTRMEGTINDLLVLSRLEHAEVSNTTEHVCMLELINGILLEASALSGDDNHEITVAVDNGINVLGDAAELRSAFSNLVFNAVRYTPPRSTINIRWAAHEYGAELSIVDNGEGIPARHIPRLTERFYRVDPGRSRDSGGTGLGLAIVKHVLTRHDAELKISSEIGKGSTFSCIFPAQRLVTVPCEP